MQQYEIPTETEGKNETPVSFKSFRYHSINPFIGDVIEHVSDSRLRKVAGSKYQQVLNESTGELENQKILILGEQKKVDKQQYYKVFFGSIKSFFDLSKNTMKLFEYIMENISYGNDRICLSNVDIQTKIGISRATVYRATIQLLEADILAKADTEGCFFVNPTVAFKGDRITLIKQYIMEEKKNQKLTK